MDLSAIIFVVLALAWAVYLIPKALKHHDEMASDRLVEGHSDKVRILSRKNSRGRPEVGEVEVEHVDTVDRTSGVPRLEVAPLARRRQVTRAAARRAAQRRRSVLAVLVLALAVVWALTWFAYLPIWAPGVPGAMAILFLVVARLSVRRMQAGSPAKVVERVETPAVEEQPPLASPSTADLVERLTAETTLGAPRQEIEAALADDGSLWDPLPVNLPTYVGKARARRTVRTIELTGINSSGHDRADTTLVHDTEVAKDAQDAESGEPGRRKVSGA